ncbi:FtsX-like permease family protein [Blautia coccoides]|uniref:ABC transporter permease n=1 Tax=Blautia producta TaxID=33035 RepID=UPI0028A349A3|nr:FtsX-like permease family protein [Blautia coccoides]MDT4377043.1 FtsX-like permease family protein [Blautia coccoides]
MFSKQYSIIRKFSNRNMRDHKIRNFLMIAIVMCLTTLICAMTVLSSSTYKNMERYYLQQNGNTSQVLISGVPEGNIAGLSQNSSIEEVGQSILIGNASNEEFNDRPTEVRYADTVYAEYALSLPDQGRMPEADNEIAVDTSVLKDMGATETLGTNISIEWTDAEGEKQTKDFDVVGIWEGNDICPTRNLWVSEKNVSNPDEIYMDVAFNLKNSKGTEAALQQIAEDLKISTDNIVTNWVYSDSVQNQFEAETFVYKIGIGLILVCGFLIIYNIMEISIVSDSKLYGRIKTMGSTPKQVRFSVFYQYFIDALIGIPLGLILGYGLGSAVVPDVIISLGPDLAVYVNVFDFIITAALVLAVVMIACIRPAFHACSINPSDLLSEESNLNISGRSHRRSPGFPALFELSLTNLGRYRKRNFIAIILLTAGLVSLSCVYVINHSFDISKYMNEIALSNVTITEKSLVDSWGVYDPQGETISSELISDLEATGGIVERGTLYSQDVMIQVPEKAYNNVIAYYEAGDGEKLQYMEQDAGWTEGYNSFKDSKSCVATIFGIDGLVNDKISEAERIINGTIDKEKFLSGNYVIAQGYMSDSGKSELQPTYDVGDTVVINDREFEVMAIVEAPYPVTEGKINPGSEFCMSFFVSAGDFLEMFPENTPRKLFLNIEESKIQDVENVLTPYVENGVPVETENTIQEHYMNETKSATLLQNLVCIMLLIIGTVNLINVIITSTTARKKEFAMMQSIGMTKKQLRCLLVMEGLNISVITLIISYFLSMVIISTVLKSYLATQWTATYHFSIMPLLVLTPFLILLPVIVSIICFNHMQKTDIIDRLQGEDE